LCLGGKYNSQTNTHSLRERESFYLAHKEVKRKREKMRKREEGGDCGTYFVNNKLNIIHDRMYVDDLILKKMFEFLLKCIFSQTPLHVATYFGYKECCKILLEYGADKTIKNVSYFYFVLIETNREIKTERERGRK